jgi:VanZ family protein
MNERGTRVLRALPFLAGSAISIWVAAQAPEGQKPFAIDLSLSLDLVLHTLTKTRHFAYISVLTALAVVAMGAGRLWLAFSLTMAIGVAWELAQTTVAGRNARIADLAPDIVAGLVCVLIIKVLDGAAGHFRGRKEGQVLPRPSTSTRKPWASRRP